MKKRIYSLTFFFAFQLFSYSNSFCENSANEKPFWLLQWHLLHKSHLLSVGGQIFVKVYQDKSVEITFGE